MKVALVHDFLTEFGEKEEVLFELTKIFPEAPVYTFLYDPAKMWNFFPPQKVRVSFFQKLPEFVKKWDSLRLLLLAIAPETFDLRDFDLVISSCSGFAKGVVTRPKTIHICYCHNPATFIWGNFGQGKKGIFSQLVANYLRLWDKSAGRRVDHFLANSKDTAQRIVKYYQQEAKIVFPPVRLCSAEKVSFSISSDYFLIVSPLAPESNLEMAILAFNKLDLPLVIVGEGSEEGKLRKLAGPKIRIVSRSQEADSLYENCRAFILPGTEDFGISAVKAMGFGKPVLALSERGALDFVLPGMTGELFTNACPESLADGVRRLCTNYSSYSPFIIKKWAARFSAERFRCELMELVGKFGYNKEKNDAYRPSANLELFDQEPETK